MSETNLRAALDQHLNTMAGAPPIAWENRPFDPNDTIYLTAHLLPATPQSVGVESGGSDVAVGLYQITVNAKLGTGKAGYLPEVEKLVARFARSQTISYGDTTVALQLVYSSPAITGDNYFHIPVSVRYRGLTA